MYNIFPYNTGLTTATQKLQRPLRKRRKNLPCYIWGYLTFIQIIVFTSQNILRYAADE